MSNSGSTCVFALCPLYTSANVYIISFLSLVTAPSGRVSGVSVSVNVSNLSVMISWDELQSDKWNGVMEYYVVVVADVTPGSGFQLRQLVPVKETSLIIYNVKVSLTHLHMGNLSDM